MSASAPSLISRPDTMLGVCEGLGQDFGFDPLWLRVALAVTVFWSPLVALSVYLGLGVAVLASRLAFPRAKGVTSDVAETPAADNDDQSPTMAEAA